MITERVEPAGGEDPQRTGSSRELSGTTPSVLRHIRGWVAKELATLGSAHREDVVLVADELLSNAYDHGDGPHLIRLGWLRAPCLVTVEVEDANHEPLTVGRSRFTGHRGRGLAIIEKLAVAWGVIHSPDDETRKTVWAEIGCAEEPCAPEDQRR